jgi:hypothetical protein
MRILLSVLTIISLIFIAPIRAGAATAGGIQRVTATASTIEVSGEATGDVAIYALDPAQSDQSGATPVSTISATGAFTISAPRFAGGVDRYYDKFLAVSGGSALGSAHYVDDPEFAAQNDYPYPATTTIKGLSQVDMTDDAESLGAHHAGVNVALNSIMRKGPGDPGTYIPFESNGATYYFDKARVEQLDGQIKPLSDDGIVVNLILILYQDSDPNSAFSVLVHPDARIGAGTVYAFNTATAQGVAYYTAAMEFLAGRYSRDDQEYGRAVNYIVGNEVDAAWVWAQMGDQSLSDFVEYYSRALRITWQAARKYYASARVYVSLEHNWDVSPDPTKPLQAYPGRSVLDTLAATSRSEGDFPWDVAYHPYPQDLTNPRVWDDTQAVDSPESPLITFKNIQVLPQYLRQESLEFNGAPRRIILSEQGCNTPSDSEADQQLQAACYAYAYYKVLFAGGIDAFNLHRHVDHPLEGGLRLGLWSWDPAKPTVNGYNMPGDPKYVYDVFKYIDTSRSTQVTNFALKIIGIHSWRDVIPNFDPAKLDRRGMPALLSARTVEAVHGPVPVAPLNGWRAADNANAVDVDSAALHVHFDANLTPVSTDAKVWKGADTVLSAPLNAAARPQLTLSLNIPADAPAGNTFQTQIRVYGKKGVGYGIADVSPGTNTIALDLRHWMGRTAINRIKVWVRGSTDDNWAGTIDISNVALARSVTG